MDTDTTETVGEGPEWCVFCGSQLACDGDCDHCAAAWERGEVLS